MRTVLVCNNRMQAELAKGNLENMDFHPVVFDRSFNAYPGAIFSGSHEITVEVPDAEYEAVKAFLAQESPVQEDPAQEDPA